MVLSLQSSSWIFHHGCRSFIFIVLRLLQIHSWVKKLNLFNFTHAPKQSFPPGFYHYPPGRPKLPSPPKQHFLKILPFFFVFFHTAFFSEQKEGGEDYVFEKIPTLTRVLVILMNSTIFVTYIFGLQMFCCAII